MGCIDASRRQPACPDYMQISNTLRLSFGCVVAMDLLCQHSLIFVNAQCLVLFPSSNPFEMERSTHSWLGTVDIQGARQPRGPHPPRVVR
jgi:hypothetical protein